MNKRQIAQLKLHTAVVIFGFTGILGRLITLDQVPLVWYRMLIASVGLLVLPRFWKGIKTVKWRQGMRISLTGIIVAFHWITFFASIKLSNVSFALCMLASSAWFTSMLEPVILKQKFRWKEFLLGMMVIPGILLIFNGTKMYFWGAVTGLISAFLASLFGTFNKTFVGSVRPSVVSFLELSTGFIIISMLLPLYFIWKPEVTLWSNNPMDIVWLLILGIVCTTIAFIFTVDSLKELSAFTTSLAINLEPIYGIVLAVLIFKENEEMGVSFILGAITIVLAIVINGVQKVKG